MIRLGMSIPTLPGRSRRPRPKHPGTKNIEKSKVIPSVIPPDNLTIKPFVTPAKTRIPKLPTTRVPKLPTIRVPKLPTIGIPKPSIRRKPS